VQAETGIGRVLRRPAFWGLVGGAIAAVGAYACRRIPVEVLPRFDFPQIRVVAREPGATPSELESLIVRPLEGEILSLPNLAGARSGMGDGTVEIDARFVAGTDAQTDLQAVNGAIDRARGELPPGIRPEAEIMGNAVNEVADYTARIPAGLAPAEVQRAVLAGVAPALRAVPGVQRVEVYGSGDEALWIQPDLAALHRYGVPVTALIRAVREQVLLEPVGHELLGHQDVRIEARDLPVRRTQLADIPVPGPRGPIPLGALARVVRAAIPAPNAVLLDGRPSIALTILKQPGASTVPVTRAVQAALAATLNLLPPGVTWVRTYDQGRLVHLVAADLGRNLALGGALAIAVLLWMLGAGRGIWLLALSIPLSLLLAVAGLYFAGQSLNLMTLGALTVAVGLLADDGILVLESIYHCWEEGDPRWDGIRRGVRLIAVPDLTGTLTNVAVYLPLLFIGGLAGLFFVPFALAMTFALLASLAVSLSLIPLGLGFIRARPPGRPTRGQAALERIRRANERLFDLVSRRPRLSLALAFGLLLLSLGGLVAVPVDFLPLPNEGVLLESFTLPPGSSLPDTEAAVETITRRLLADSAVAHVFVRIGSAATTGYTEASSAGEIQIALRPGVTANRLDAVGARLERESRLPGVQLAVDTPTIERVGESLSGLPQPFAVRLFGGDLAELRLLAGRLTSRLRSVGTLTGVFNNDAYPVTELQVLPESAALAAHRLTPAALAAQIRPLLAGEIVARVPDGNVPLALYVRLADAPDRGLRELGRLPIRTEGWTPLDRLAKLRLVAMPNRIRHVDGARVLEILATPTGLGGVAAARRAAAGLALPAGYRVAIAGLYPELERMALGLGVAALAALGLMIAVLLLQFDGLLIPGILLLEIPLAVMGGAVALIVSGVGLNATGLIAFLTLIGIGLAHGIVLLDRARRNEAEGLPVEEAVREAVRVRFRPIVLTTLTAVLGMAPTALGWGQGAAPEQGLAVVILGGVLWSGVRSTNLIPALYLHWRRRQLAKGAQP
jgi:multidrug efflux pump subunit AcrB